jgi:hypothetical protein
MFEIFARCAYVTQSYSSAIPLRENTETSSGYPEDNSVLPA